jgi:hypothetical protein
MEEAAAAQPDLSSVSTLTTLTEGLLRDYDSLVARSGTGLRSCKEVHAFLKERASIEATYGNALVRQARASAGSLERGTCRMGWFAFKSETESIGRKHLVRSPPAQSASGPASTSPARPPAQELASHYNADVTALQYLRDRLAGAHRTLVAEGSGAPPAGFAWCPSHPTRPGSSNAELARQARSRMHARAWQRCTRRVRATPTSPRVSTPLSSRRHGEQVKRGGGPTRPRSARLS